MICPWWLGLAVGVAPVGVEWTIVDLAAQKSYVVPAQAEAWTAGGRLEAAPEGAELALTVDHRVDGPVTRAQVHLADRSGRDRGLTVRLTLTLAGDGWRWWHDLDIVHELGDEPLSNVTGLRELPGLPEFAGGERPDYGRYSAYPLGAVQSEAGWIALARPQSPLALVRFAAQGGPPRLTAEVDLALSEYSRPPREAEFELWLLHGEDDTPGLRAALAAYYALAPAHWEVRAPDYGGWMPFTDLAKLPNVDEFGFMYQEGAPNPTFDDALGALSFVYFHCAGEFANVPGYQRGAEPQPPYEQVVAAFNAVAERNSGVPNAWDLCGIRDAEGRIAYRPEKTYGDFFCQACVDPDLPYGQSMIERLMARVERSPYPEGVDGVYYDGIAAGLDYDPSHLQAADHLLLWDARLGRPVNYNLWSSAEWAEAIHRRLAGTGKLTMLNDSSLASFAFVAPWIDVPGGELSIHHGRPQNRLIRALTGRKPFCTLVKADFTQYSTGQIETYMRRAVSYGMLPGFFDISPSGDHPGSSYWLHPEWYDRDRGLFRRYLPLARELARAGWEPVTGARLSGAAQAERFGPRDGLTYYTVSTDPREDHAAQLVTLTAPAPPGTLAVELLTGRIEPADGPLAMQLADDDLAVWAVGPPEAQAAAAVGRAADLLDRRERYLAAIGARAETLSPWAPYDYGGARIVAPGRDGGHALRIERPEGERPAGANLTVNVQHDRPHTLIVSAWSRAENVTGPPSRDCSVYIDVYYTDGTALYGQTINLDTGSHDWQYGERTIELTKPARNINVYLLLRGPHYGTIQLDDVRVATAEEPAVNLVPRGDFEPATDAPLAGGSPAAVAVNEAFARLRERLTADTLDLAAAEELLGSVETTARDADWGADSERTLRDVADLRWHLALAAACRRGAPQAAQRASRVTAFAPLGTAARPAGGVRRYRTTAGNLPRGTLITVDSNYEGYTAEVLTDGRINPAGAHWTQVAWASADTDGEHSIELTLPSPTRVDRVRVHWALDNSQLQVSRTVRLEIPADGGWAALEAELRTEGGVTEFALGGRELSRFRLYQPTGGGPVGRPGILWVSELEVLAVK